MIDHAFSERMRSKLIFLRGQLEAIAQTGSDAAGVVELDQAKVGRLSRMDALQAQAMSQASGRRRDQALKSIQSALARLDNAAFGTCGACDEPIARARLEFDPTATLCIDCATRIEQDGNPA